MVTLTILLLLLLVPGSRRILARIFMGLLAAVGLTFWMTRDSHRRHY